MASHTVYKWQQGTVQGYCPVEIVKRPAVSLEMLRRVTEDLMKNAAPGFHVKTAKEAEMLTANDSSGHQWVVGQRYYRLESIDGRVFFRGNEQ